PAPTGQASWCDDGNPCTVDGTTDGGGGGASSPDCTGGPICLEVGPAVECTHNAVPNGMPCSVPAVFERSIPCGDDQFNVVIDASCRPEQTQCNGGLCGPFSSATIADDTITALYNLCRTTC